MLLPSSVEVNGTAHELIELPKDKSGCVILETVHDPRNGAKSIHIIPLSNTGKIYLGRGHDNDIRIQDISVSRSHAIITVKSGAAYISDNSSKFGTLAKISSPILLEEGADLTI